MSGLARRSVSDTSLWQVIQDKIIWRWCLLRKLIENCLGFCSIFFGIFGNFCKLFVGRLRTLMPCIRDMARRGLSALNVRIVLKAWIPPAPASEATKLISDTCQDTLNTTTQHNTVSQPFHTELKEPGPKTRANPVLLYST